MRILLSLLFLCATVAAVDTPEQQEKDSSYAALLMDSGHWKDAMVLIDHLESQNFPRAAHLRELIAQHAPENEKEYEARRQKNAERSKKGREDLRSKARSGNPRDVKLYEINEKQFAESRASQLAEARERAVRVMDDNKKEIKKAEKQAAAKAAKEREDQRRRENELLSKERNQYAARPRLSDASFGKVKTEVWFAVKEDIEHFGFYTLTLDVKSLGDDPKDMNFHVSYNMDPSSMGDDVQGTLLGILTKVSEELRKHGYNAERDNIPLRARAFKVVGNRVYPFGMGRWLSAHKTYEFSRTWWEFTDGE